MTPVFNRAHDKDSTLLQNGDKMSQEEFHRRYDAMPEGYRAELVGGVVFEPSPLGYSHSTTHVRLSYLLQTYVLATPGVEAGDNATVILSNEDEVQPDLILRVSNRCKGQSRAKKFVEGAPELVAEIAHSSRAIDLHLKKERYSRAGVREYIVLTSQEPLELYWFDMKNGAELEIDANGIIRSQVFPGLWIDRQGLLELDHNKTASALAAGLESAEHKEFVLQLDKLRKARKRKKH